MPVIDEKLLREPNLLTPGKKPVGNVEIGEFLYAEYISYYLLSRASYTDMRGWDLTWSSNLGLGLPIVSGAMSFNGSSTWLRYQSAPADFGSGDYSIFARFKTSAASSKRQILFGTGRLSSASGGWNLEQHDTRGMLFSHFDGSAPAPQLETGTYFNDNKWHTIGITWKADNSRREMWVDGHLYDNDSGETNTGIDRDETNYFAIGACLTTSNTTDANNWLGYIDNLIVFKGLSLSSSITQSLTIDPYQILKPA